jgi:GT2 family glycosyltransferase
VIDLPRVSLIILNYNGRAYLDRCLQSALDLDYPADRLEVILCDNGSTDGSIDYVRSRYARIRVVPLDRNYGFAEGNNRAAAQARGDWTAFINNDMWFEPSWLRDFVGASLEHPAIDCFTCRIMNWRGTAIDFVGSAVNFEGHGFQLAHGSKDSAIDRERRVIAPCGGAMLIRRDLFLDVGGFDPAYFSFFEDTDLGWRLNLLGHEVLYTPRATTYHMEHATAKRFPAYRLRVLYERNALFTIYKCLDDANLAVALPAALLLSNERALQLAEIPLDAFRIRRKGQAGAVGRDVTAGEGSPKVRDRAGRAMRELGLRGMAKKAARYLRRRIATALRRPLLKGGYFVPSMALSHHVAMHEFAANLDKVMEKRRWIQSRRVRSDAELLPLLVEPLRPTWDDPDYVRFHRWLSTTMGLTSRFGPPA